MRSRALSMVLLLASGWTLSGPAGAQDSSGIVYSPYRHFKIPFKGSTPEQRLKQLQLFVSTDQGKSWQQAATAPPEQGHFKFLTEKDGYFWFAVQTQDSDGRLYPVRMDGATPNLKVVVDTQPPLVLLQPLTPRGDEVGISWDIRDENLDLTLPDALQAEYRPVGSNSWLPLPRTLAGPQLHWNPMTRSAVQVRVRARDRAGNWGEATASVSLDGSVAPPVGNNEFTQPTVNPDTGPPGRKFVNNKRITLKYDLKEVGPSGVAEVELWFTQDGRSWNKYPPRVGEDPTSQRNVTFEVNSEGVYGITLVAKSGVGLGAKPPQLGDRPQAWIEVDMTKPMVQLQNVIVGQGADKGKLTISWSARDKNLNAQPITLSHGETLAGPWTPIVQNVANSGQHVWTMPERVPYQFHVRVEAVDQANNVGYAITSQLIKVDLSQPKVQILQVEPAGN
ncbi:MAG: hypothetical protein FJ271_04405 [Planctomycetes bacterium]|nr:hypothetical protein [Planctomycetota bacterium]